MTPRTNEPDKNLDPEDSSFGYIPYIKNYTTNWLLIRLFFIRILLLTPNERAYGKFLIDLAISYRVARKERAILIIIPKGKEAKNRANHHYLRLRSELITITIVPKTVSFLGLKLLKLLQKIENLYLTIRRDNHYPALESTQFPTYFRRRLVENKFPIHLTDTHHHECGQILEELNISADRRIVTIHIRDSIVDAVDGYDDWQVADREQRRGTELSTYRLAINHLIEHDYVVVRIGTITQQTFSMKGFIDLTQRPDISKIMEPYFMLRSQFLIASDSGPCMGAYLTNTPVLLTNSSNSLISSPIRTFDIQLLRPVQFEPSGTLFSISDYLSPYFFNNRLDFDKYRYGHNSPQEILSAVEEMMWCLGKGWPAPDTNQKQFSEQSHDVAKSILSQPDNYPIGYVAFKKWGPDNNFLGYGRVAKACFEPEFGGSLRAS